MGPQKINVGIIYYTQTGQIKDVVSKIVSGFDPAFECDYIEIKSSRQFPFPWSTWEFFDTMPETVLGESVPVELIGWDRQKKYDLIILAFQPWFLSPSIPFHSFMQTDDAKTLIQGANVLTVIGARNMWLNALETVKGYVIRYGGRLVGNIPFVDTNPNLISTLTVIRWAMQGQKEASRFLPAAGIQEKELNRAPSFGKIVSDHYLSGQLEQIQPALVSAGAVALRHGLILLEQTGIQNFRKFAKFIKSKGEPMSLERKPAVNLFKNILVTGIFILSPIKAIVSAIQLFLKRKKLAKDLVYFQSIDYKEGRI